MAAIMKFDVKKLLINHSNQQHHVRISRLRPTVKSCNSRLIELIEGCCRADVTGRCLPLLAIYAVIMIIIQAFVKRAMSANIPNLRHRQSLGEEDGGSEV